MTQNSDSVRIQVSALNSRRTDVLLVGIPVDDVPSIDDAYLVSTSGRGPFVTEIGDPFPSETIWTGVGGGGVIISSWNERRGFLGYPSLYNFDAYELASKLRLP